MGVVIKKKKPLLLQIIGKIKDNTSSFGKDSVAYDVLLAETRTSRGDMIAVESRRNELRSAAHYNSDAIVTF